MNDEKVSLDLLVETSWEVCNKVGGIYTVLSTKAHTLRQLYGDKVVFIGPDVWSEENPSPFFKESKTLMGPWRKNAALPYGIKVRVGRWDVPGNPIAILVKFDGLYAENNRLYGILWEKFGVDSLHNYGDYAEACAFSHAAAIVIESIVAYKKIAPVKVAAHFNEWTTGAGLLMTRLLLPQAATIFTTHATSIGRSICGNGKPLYDYLHAYDGDQMARELNMEAKHSLEKTAAREADCFTTVSDITAVECEQLLALKPHVVTPNGFEQGFVPQGKEYDSERQAARIALARVASTLTASEIDPDTTCFIATSGRCEYRNKGLDVYLDSLYRLSSELKDGQKAVAFVMVPAWTDRPREDLVNRLSDNTPEQSPLSLPAITHWLHNMDSDPVLCHIRRLGFDRDADSRRLNVIYVPCYLNGSDGIFNIPYYGLLSGMDVTVFPSYYEPWGYTPLESVAFGIPTVTTSLSGFGQWILHSLRPGFKESGVVVTSRTDSNYADVVKGITAALTAIMEADPRQRNAISRAAHATASKAAWEYFIKYYIEAFRTAFDNAERRLNKK